MRTIRPHQLFALVEDEPCDRVANVMIPARRAVGGTTLLETMLLIAAARAVKARRVFEFGTFLGTNTFNLALNTPDDGVVYTLDLPTETMVQHEADLAHARCHLAATELDFEGHPEADKKIVRLCGNSRVFRFSPWADSINLSFIDGGHDEETVRSDTRAAFLMLSPQQPSAVIWHDYGNPAYPELTRYLDDLAETAQIVHVEDTTLCMALCGLEI